MNDDVSRGSRRSRDRTCAVRCGGGDHRGHCVRESPGRALAYLAENGGAEAGPGRPDESNVVAKIPGWTSAVDDRGGQFNVLAYQSISPKDAQRGNFWPSTAASRLIKGGRKLFVCGYMAPGRTNSTPTQSVNVAGQRKAIDAGRVSATLAAALGGIGSSNDTMTVVAAFRAGLRQETRPDQDLDRSSRHSTRRCSRIAGTPQPCSSEERRRTCRRTLGRSSSLCKGHKVDGAYCDAIADDLSLTLGAVR